MSIVNSTESSAPGRRFRAPLLALGLVLALQGVFSVLQPRQWRLQVDLPAPPSVIQWRIGSLGETRGAATAAVLFAQSFDAQAGQAVGLRSIDLTGVFDWLGRAAELAPDSGYPTFLISRIYAGIAPPDLARRMLDWIHDRFQTDPQTHWPWLAQAAHLARHELHDTGLARRYAQALRTADAAVTMPAWARELEAFMLRDLDELDSARVLLGGLIASGQVSDPRALAVMIGDLRDIEHRLSADRRAQAGAPHAETESEPGFSPTIDPTRMSRHGD